MEFVIIGAVAVVVILLVIAGRATWHVQGLGILAACLLALGVAVNYGPGWFGI